jgi:hypothetical protein
MDQLNRRAMMRGRRGGSYALLPKSSPKASLASLCASRCAGPSKRVISSLMMAALSDSGET